MENRLRVRQLLQEAARAPAWSRCTSEEHVVHRPTGDLKLLQRRQG